MSQATILSTPATPASAYRPLTYKVQGRGIAPLSLVGFIRAADSSDVSTYGGGLAVGDILVEHASMVSGTPTVGARVYIEGCGSYNGIWEIAKVIDQSGAPAYITIEASDYGAFTGTGSSLIVMWPDAYTVYAEVSVYTDTTAPPTKFRLKGTPDNDGVATFHVDTEIKNYFNSDISSYVLPVTGGALAQNAHGVTALFYTTRFVEGWKDSPPMDPWDGSHEIDEDEEYLVAVNAIHPYYSSLTTWETDDLEDFLMDDAETGRLFLTNAPRSLTLASSDYFRLFFLVPDPYNGRVTIRVNTMVNGTPTGELVAEEVDFGTETAAICIAVGPADLTAFGEVVPTNYRVFVSNEGGDQLSEYFYFEVDTKCREVRRPMAALNSLGGVDLFTFTGREITTDRGKRGSITKPFGEGTGYDYTERVYRNDPSTIYNLSSAPQRSEVRQWLTRLFIRSANVVTRLSSTQAAPVILVTEAAQGHTTAGSYKPLTIEYRLGTDGMAQRA